MNWNGEFAYDKVILSIAVFLTASWKPSNHLAMSITASLSMRMVQLSRS
uniref:Neur_chan_memb domain-containing protein n=1 Tax=Ascaris lumbricoides TaxID=6252 RepID=A0A0M3HLH3_ASCLU